MWFSCICANTRLCCELALCVRLRCKSADTRRHVVFVVYAWHMNMQTVETLTNVMGDQYPTCKITSVLKGNVCHVMYYQTVSGQCSCDDIATNQYICISTCIIDNLCIWPTMGIMMQVMNNLHMIWPTMGIMMQVLNNLHMMYVYTPGCSPREWRRSLIAGFEAGPCAS